MKQLLISTAWSLLMCSGLHAQELYKPRDVKEAYLKGTRSLDGKPGARYWQNTARYDITVTATPPERNISGTETITYVNQSPDTLQSLVIRLIQNVHAPGATREYYEDSAYFNTGIHIDRFSMNGKDRPWKENGYKITWRPVKLNQGLAPHDSIHLSFDWHYEIPLSGQREGVIDSTTFFLAYFYPRVSVYDDVDGWDRMDFKEEQEFYNDFNDYTLHVVVPTGYLVWATGTLRHPESLLQPTYANRLEASMHTDSVIHIVSESDLKAGSITVANPSNTWTFTASNVTDVTTGLSDHFVWDGSSVLVDNATGRTASVQSAYNDTATDFHEAVAVGKHSLDWFSHHLPGVPYPFPKMTVMQGYYGQEYPMMANDESTGKDLNFARFVEEHEIAHTWFPFYMGINETRYGFMDEGWATTLELLIGRVDMGMAADSAFRDFRINTWANHPSPENDIPIMTPGNVLSGEVLGDNEYGKPALGYLAMMDLLGEDLFKKCLHAYMDRWHGKHPIPWDFFYTFDNVSGRDLNWFWNDWYFSPNYIDFSIKGVTAGKGSNDISIENVGGMYAPFDLNVTFTDGSQQVIHKTPAVWEKGNKVITVTIPSAKKIKTLSLDGGVFMDADLTNNTWTAP
jgi:hypothetical protein